MGLGATAINPIEEKKFLTENEGNEEMNSGYDRRHCLTSTIITSRFSAFLRYVRFLLFNLWFASEALAAVLRFVAGSLNLLSAHSVFVSASDSSISKTLDMPRIL